jgi:alpha/beta superfamily hydrolase
VAHGARGRAVIAHPHPLHGGTLHNPVVFHVDRELHGLGLSTLRFNFRGVGASQGAHDEGRGEVEDVGAAVRWLAGIDAGTPLLLVGYSFGSWCCVRHAVRDPAVAALIAIGLPVRKYAFDALAELDRPVAVVQGTADEFGSAAEVRAALAITRPDARVTAIEGASHLFPGRVRDAAAAVAAAAAALLAAR